MRRTALTVLIAFGWLVALSGPASAHSVSGVGATNWKTVITGVSPRLPGVSLRVVEGGSRLEVTNRGPELTVIGYQHEPYLRVGPQGVFENTRSPATYLNCARTGCPGSPNADPQAPPEWRQIATGQTARWHDHRIHWMGLQLPPEVARAPNQVHVEASWAIEMRQGTTPIIVSGNYTWLPGPSPWPWLVLALMLLAATVAAAVTGRWGFASGLRGRPGVLLAVAVLVLTVSDVYHALAIALFWSGDLATRAGKFFSGSFYSVTGWVLGLLAAWMLARRRIDGLYAAVFAGVSATLFTGLLDFSVLARSQAPFAGPVSIDRLTVAVSLGLGLGVTVGSLLAIRRAAEYDADQPEESEPEPA